MFGRHTMRGGCGPRESAGRDCGPGGSRGGRRHWGPFTVEWSMDDARGGGRGRRRVFDGGELRLILLALIADAPRHGYDLIREIEERTGGAYAPSPGVVYPTLTLLADMDLVIEQASDGAKKVFAITDAGKAHLEERAEEVTMLFARLTELGTQRERGQHGPVRRAMQNVKMALAQRLGQGETDAEVMHQIAEILDDAARRIERL